MKHFKNILSIILLLCVILTLASCTITINTPKQNNDTDNTKGPNVETETTDPSISDNADDTQEPGNSTNETDSSIDLQIIYDEAKFQHAANEHYKELFKSGNTYENNILLYFLVEESCNDLYYIAWVGDNICSEITSLLGNNYSALGQLIQNNIPQYYAYSLDANIATIIRELENSISNMSLSSSFYKKPIFTANANNSKLIDLTQRQANETLPELIDTTLNNALASFTKTTGISIVVLVDYMDNVFETEPQNP